VISKSNEDEPFHVGVVAGWTWLHDNIAPLLYVGSGKCPKDITPDIIRGNSDYRIPLGVVMRWTQNLENALSKLTPKEQVAILYSVKTR